MKLTLQEIASVVGAQNDVSLLKILPSMLLNLTAAR